MTEFVTSVSDVEDGVVNLRGYSLEEVMRNLPYSSGAFLSIVGRLPTAAENSLLDALLNSLLDHGFVASTITAARYAASGNPQLVPAVAAGLLAAGSNTVSPQHSYEVLRRAEAVRAQRQVSAAEAAEVVLDEFISAKRRLPGLGHPTHKESDFRSDVLFEVARSQGLAGPAVEQFIALQKAFEARTGKHLPINIDGAMAAIGFDLGWTTEQVVAFAILSVLPGIIAHVIEEMTTGKPLRHIKDGSYAGPAIRPLPESL
jgi:citrate synthase